MKSTKGLTNKPFSTPWDFHASYNPIMQHSILKLTLKQGYEKYKQWVLEQLLYWEHGCSGEDKWAAGAAQRLEANTKHPSPGWGSTRPRLRVNWSSLNHPQRWTLHKPATGSRPRWLLGRAGTQESPCCEGEFTPKQNWLWSSLHTFPLWCGKAVFRSSTFKEFPRCVFKHLPSNKKVSLTVESIMQSRPTDATSCFSASHSIPFTTAIGGKTWSLHQQYLFLSRIP